jgi:hypothetical protein
MFLWSKTGFHSLSDVQQVNAFRCQLHLSVQLDDLRSIDRDEYLTVVYVTVRVDYPTPGSLSFHYRSAEIYFLIVLKRHPSESLVMEIVLPYPQACIFGLL